MVYQSGRNIAVAYKVESTYGEAAGATGGKVFRPNPGPGLNLTKTPINSNEVRQDGMMTRGRHGSIAVAGSYPADASIGSYDDFIEAVFRGTFDTAVSIDDETVAMSSATLAVGANTITASAGSWITSGLRVGDVIRATEGLDSTNLNRNLRITALTATVITVAETLTVEAGPIATFTIARPRKVVQGTTARSFTVEEREIDIDASEVFTGVRIGSVALALQPNSMATLTFNMTGQDADIATDSASPYFTTPATTTSIGLTAVEAKIRLGSADILDITSLNLTIDIGANGVPVVGSNLTPDVFTNLANVTGSITALKSDAARVQQFLDEDQLSLHLMFEELGTGLVNFMSFHIPNMTLGSATKSNLGDDNARTTSFDLLVGIDQRGGAYDQTMVKFQTSTVAA